MFCGYSQNGGGLKRDLSSNVWWLRNANYVKFTEEWLICAEKQVLVKKDVYVWAEHSFYNYETVHGVETYQLSSKKGSSAGVTKKGHVETRKDPFTTDFLY